MSLQSEFSYTDTTGLGLPAILFLHGFLGSKEDWREIIYELQPEFRCIAVDLPGHGESVELDESCFSMDLCAQEIVYLLDRLRIPSCHLVGYSMGGRLALYLLTHFPDRFSRSVFESASPGLKSDLEREARQAHDEALAERLQSVPLEQFVREWYRQPLFEPLLRDEDRMREIYRRRLKNDPAGLARSLRQMGTGIQPPLWPKLSTIKVPVLYLAGELDSKFSLIAAEMASQTPKSRAEIFVDCGHALHLEAPDIYISRVRAFLTA